MPRLRASDYDQKKAAILDAAATLFDRSGYAGCKMQDIAEACSVSKSMLYHYFMKKEDVLFETLRQHLASLLDSLSDVRIAPGAGGPHGYFRAAVEAYLESSMQSRAKHLVALNDRRFLIEAQQKQITDLERQVLKFFEEVLRQTRAGESADYYRIHALLLIGMMNWVELWYRRSGRVTPQVLYRMINDLFLDGFSPSRAANWMVPLTTSRSGR